MPHCMCCLKETARLIALECLHLTCKQCFEAVKIEGAMFCMECCRMSNAKPTHEMSEVLKTEDCDTWERTAALKFSGISLNVNHSHLADSPLTPAAQTACHINGVFPTMLHSQLSILPKYGTHHPFPDYFWCTVTQAVTPQSVGVQIIDEELKRFKLMDEKMQNFYKLSSQNKKLIIADQLSTGACYCVKRKGKWYRALVLRDTKWICLSLLDFGIIYWVHENNYVTVQPMQPEFTELPAQGVHCTLNDEPSCYHKEKQLACRGLDSECWDPKCRNFMIDKTDSKALCLVSPQPGVTSRVIMYINNEEISLNQQIIEKGFSRRTLDEDHVRLFKMSDALRKDILAKVPAEISLKKENKPKWTTTPPSQAWPKEFRGLVTWVDDRAKVFIHTTEWANRLIYIKNRLKEVFSASVGTVHRGFLEVGDSCFVKYKNNWFRAVLEELLEEEATVFLIDFGVTQKVSPKAIRVKDAFFKIPVQTYRCVLEGIAPINEQGSQISHYSESAVNLLHDLTVNNEFHVKVEMLHPLRVTLRCIDSNVSVADVLVAAKKAKHR